MQFNLFSTIAIYAALAVLSFFIINWIGGHTLHGGYMMLSLFYKEDEAPAFNTLYRILAPNVLVIFYASALYALSYDQLATHIWVVVPMMFTLRALFNIAFGRARLMNWLSYLIQSLLASCIAFLIHKSLITRREFLFPDLKTFGNELWLALFFFAYQLLNGLQLDPSRTLARKERYLDLTFLNYKKRYQSIIDQHKLPPPLEVLTYSIMILESFNRPSIVRWVERALHPFRKKGTYGVMQVHSDKALRNEESIHLGIKKLQEDYEKVEQRSRDHVPEYLKAQGEQALEHMILKRTAWLYNHSDTYAQEVMEVYTQLESKFYKPPPEPKDPYNAFESDSFA